MPDSAHPPLIDDADGLRLARYLAGECSPEEAEQIRRRLVVEAELARAVEELRRVWQATGRSPAPRDINAAWRELVAARAARQVRNLSVAGWPVRRTLWIVRVAAAIVLAVGGAAMWHFVLRTSPPVGQEPSVLSTYVTSRGERADLRLPDGTRVMLGVESRIRVPVGYGRRTRTVELEGEAYFEVRHDEAWPFLVRTANAVSEDLGTAFIVRAYPGESVTRVVVTEGKVALRPAAGAPGTGTGLSAGDLGRLDSTGIATVTSGIDLDHYLAWTRGRLEFTNLPLRDVVPELERWYDVVIRLDDSALGSVPVTVSFQRESTEEAMQIMAQLLDVRVEQDTRVVRFTGKSR